MKRILFPVGIMVVVILTCALVAMYFWIGHDVKQNIKITQQQYPGTVENALISFLNDENNSAYDRSHRAVWTLGQVRSKKALPVLYKLYNNDPEGKTCYSHHDSQLCQYEIHKAIIAIERGRFFSHARLK